MENLLDYITLFIESSDDHKIRWLNKKSNDEYVSKDPLELWTVAKYIVSENKELAQSAAAFLLLCGGEDGINYLNYELCKGNIPHRKLIEGLIEMIL